MISTKRRGDSSSGWETPNHHGEPSDHTTAAEKNSTETERTIAQIYNHVFPAIPYRTSRQQSRQLQPDAWQRSEEFAQVRGTYFGTLINIDTDTLKSLLTILVQVFGSATTGDGL